MAFFSFSSGRSSSPVWAGVRGRSHYETNGVMPYRNHHTSLGRSRHSGAPCSSWAPDLRHSRRAHCTQVSIFITYLCFFTCQTVQTAKASCAHQRDFLNRSYYAGNYRPILNGIYPTMHYRGTCCGDYDINTKQRLGHGLETNVYISSNGSLQRRAIA